MSYKIAVASSDEIHIDETFGSARAFYIYEVTNGVYVKAEVRVVEEEQKDGEWTDTKETPVTQESCESSGSCKDQGCHTKAGGGCLGNADTSPKVELVADCRCVVCKKIGFHVQKQLERRAITTFDISCTVEEALTKISSYFDKVDSHQSLRGRSGS